MMLHEHKHELCRTETAARIIINGKAVRKRAAVAVACLRVGPLSQHVLRLKKNETVVYNTGLLTQLIKHSRTNPVYKEDSVNDMGECEVHSVTYTTLVLNKR